MEQPKPPNVVEMTGRRYQPLRGFKRLARMVFRRYPMRIFSYPRSSVDFFSEVGDGTSSSTVMAPLHWVAKTFPEAPPALWRKLEDGQEEKQRDHPVLRLLERPTPFYSGPILWMATLIDWMVDGNAYWLKVRRKTGAVYQIWYVPHWLIEPAGDEDNFITHYDYSPGFEKVKIRTEDVVHFRFGLDPDDARKGRAPLKSVLREIYTDDEAAAFTASLLRNMGVPGLIVSPDSERPISQADADATKAYLQEKFSGDKRGEPMVMTGPTKVSQFGFSPEQLLLKELRRIPEERVSAVLGVPAIVAGLGAGLDRSTFTNYTEAREAAYEQTIIPTQRILAEDLRFQLLTDFEGEDGVWDWRIGFDLSQVRVLQEDEDQKLRRIDVAIRGGWAQVSEGRRMIGLPVDERDKIYLRQMNLVQVPADGSEMTPLSATDDPVSANGNGSGDTDSVAALLGE